MDSDFEHEVLQPPLPLFMEDWTNVFGNDLVDPSIDTLGTATAGWMGPDLGLDFAISAENGMQLEQFDSALLDTELLDCDLPGDVPFEHDVGRPQDSTSIIDNSYATHGPPLFRQQADVGPFDDPPFVTAPLQYRPNHIMSDVAFLDPRREPFEWFTTNSYRCLNKGLDISIVTILRSLHIKQNQIATF